MLNTTFFHDSIRKYIITFGNLFKGIYIVRKDDDGNTIQTIPVPIKYGPSQKWIALLNDPIKTKKEAISLPMISFIITGINYDSERQISPLNIHSKSTNSDSNRRALVYQGVPYKINFELSIVGKNHYDLSQIVEQIIPYFTPTHVNRMNLIPEIDFKHDFVVNLTSLNLDDTYESDYTESRKSTWILSFEASILLFGPVSNNGIIKRVQVDIAAVSQSQDVKNQPLRRDERIVITPGLTVDGLPTTDKNESIPYQQIEKEDDFGFVEEIYTYNDQKIYDPISGNDI